jgi:hypothetical protein
LEFLQSQIERRRVTRLQEMELRGSEGAGVTGSSSSSSTTTTTAKRRPSFPTLMMSDDLAPYVLPSSGPANPAAASAEGEELLPGTLGAFLVEENMLLGGIR